MVGSVLRFDSVRYIYITCVASGYHGFWLTSCIRHLLDLQVSQELTESRAELLITMGNPAWSLQINHKSVMSNIQDPEARGTMIFAWWMACLADAYHSAYYRRKAILLVDIISLFFVYRRTIYRDDDDYDIDFYTVDPVPPEMSETPPSTREQLEVSAYLRPY